jgi:hypothetical protein
MDLTSS